MVKFGTIEYYQKLAEAINNDPEITKTDFSTTMLTVFTDLSKAFLMKFEKGKVTEVREASPSEKAEFETRAPYNMLVGIVKGEINPMQANPKYNVMKAMKYMGVLNRITSIQKGLKDVEY